MFQGNIFAQSKNSYHLRKICKRNPNYHKCNELQKSTKIEIESTIETQQGPIKLKVIPYNSKNE